MAKVVVDAYVIISAAFGGKPPGAVIRATENPEVHLSEAIAQKLMGALSGLSKKLSKDPLSFVQDNFEQLLALAKPISISTHVALSRDPKDDHSLSLCKEVEAEFLVTGGKDLLSLSQDRLKTDGILCRIVTPEEFLESIS
jgi:putative PIN family toxin of toxin-antitoxin system